MEPAFISLPAMRPRRSNRRSPTTSGLVRAIETELRDALILVSERHERNPEISRGAATLAGWSTEHLAWLEAPISRYGSTDHDTPARLRAALLGGTRAGVMGELADIADLAVLVEQASMAWTILAQGAKELHDKALVDVATEAREHNRRQLAWLRTQIEHEAPDAIAIAHDPKGQARMAVPARPTDLASIPDMAWGPAAAGGLLLAVGALGLMIGKPWLLPSLGPTAVLLAVLPAHPTARVWNTLSGTLAVCWPVSPASCSLARWTPPRSSLTARSSCHASSPRPSRSP